MCQNQENNIDKTLLPNPQILFRFHPSSYLSSVVKNFSGSGSNPESYLLIGWS